MLLLEKLGEQVNVFKDRGWFSHQVGAPGTLDIGPGPSHTRPFIAVRPTPGSALDRDWTEEVMTLVSLAMAIRKTHCRPGAATGCEGPAHSCVPLRSTGPAGPQPPRKGGLSLLRHSPPPTFQETGRKPISFHPRPPLVQPPPVASAKCRPSGPEFRRKCLRTGGLTRTFLRNPKVFTRGGNTVQNLTYSCHVTSVRCRVEGRDGRAYPTPPRSCLCGGSTGAWWLRRPCPSRPPPPGPDHRWLHETLGPAWHPPAADAPPLGPPGVSRPD